MHTEEEAKRPSGAFSMTTPHDELKKLAEEEPSVQEVRDLIEQLSDIVERLQSKVVRYERELMRSDATIQSLKEALQKIATTPLTGPEMLADADKDEGDPGLGEWLRGEIQGLQRCQSIATRALAETEADDG